MITVSDLSPEIQQRLKAAYTYQEQGAFEMALRECEAVLDAYRRFPEAHNLHGMILESLGRRSIAEMAYRTAGRLDPAFAEAARNLARIGNRLDVKLTALQKVLMGGLTAFFLGMAGMFVWMAIDSERLDPLIFTVGFVGFLGYLWALTLRMPRVIDEEGITRRDGRRVLWRDLTKTEPLTARYRGVRLGGSLRLHFKGGEIVDVPDGGISQADAVVRFVAKKTGAYPG
ncbi:MAG TPA: hypothetical protein PKH77_11240 [Anaerolineae bacterium]|nr:hypothetical protein [Anaerolineae bacterium]